MKRAFLYITMVWALNLSGQGFFKAIPDTQQIKIGEPILLQLIAEMPENSSFIWPELGQQEGIDIISSQGIDSLIKGDVIQVQQELKITSFDSGDVFILPLELVINQKDTLRTDSIPLLVYYPDIKEGQALYDIKSNREIPFNYWLLVYWALAAVTVAALAYWIWKKWPRKSQAKPIETVESRLPPGEWALLELDQLEQKKLWQNDKTKEYYSELIDILRVYLERKFALKAMESTADELVLKIKNLVDEGDLYRDLKQSLQISALVKYARHRSLAEENEKALEAIRSFVMHKESLNQSEEDV